MTSPASESNQKMKGRLKLYISKDLLRWIGTIVTLLLFIAILLQQDWDSIWRTLHQLSLGIIFLVWFLFITKIVLNSVRWFVILNMASIQIPYLECLKLVYFGMFISNFLPSTIGGDGIRFLALLRYEKDRSVALASIIADRLVSVVGMIILLPVSFFVYYDFLLLLWNSKIMGGAFLSRVPEKLRGWISSGKEIIRVNLSLFQSPKQITLSVCISWIAQSIYFLGVWIIAKNLGMEIHYLQVAGITVLAYLITLLPISVNGYGFREITITSLYSLLGYPVEVAISLAIITRIIYLSTTLIGASWLPENFSYLGKKIPELH